MKIHEYQAINLLKKFQIPVSEFVLCKTPAEAGLAYTKFNNNVVVKAQVLAGGRGKAGGIKLAKSMQETETCASSIIGMTIKGIIVEKVIVCKAVNISREFYAGFVNDRETKSVMLMFSGEGGVEIEETAKKNPEKISKLSIDANTGLHIFQARNMVSKIVNDISIVNQIADLLVKLYNCYIHYDATIAEINPLVITTEGKVLALDSKMNFDDNALFRQPEVQSMFEPDKDELLEEEAKNKGLSFIKLSGNIGCMVNGAGLAMATMDMIKLYGGSPADFLDIGGSSNPQKVIDAMDIITRDEQIKVVLINIFGGITRCDDVARGLTDAMKRLVVKVPIVVRLTGTNLKEGLEILSHTNLIIAQSMDEAAIKAIKLAK
jgi:succinyl-CoA synthetase beta subunit